MIKNKKYLSPLLFIFVASFIGFYLYKKYRIAPKILFPEIIVINEKNEKEKISLEKGRLTVVTFYASWCHDCKLEFPKMKIAKETDFSNLNFIAITDEGFDIMKNYAQTSKYPFVFYSLTKSFDEYDIYAIPTTYILNSNNEVIYSKVGQVPWKNPEFIHKIQISNNN